MSSALDNFRAAAVQQLTLDGVRLHYRMFGQGPAVLLLHGVPLCGVTYRHLIEALRPYYTCCVPDLPGAGDTPWSSTLHDTILGYTALMRSFVDALRLESFAIVGHDSGGGVARLLAAQVGPRVTSLVLQNTELPLHIPGLVRLLKLLAAGGVLAPVLQRMLRYSPLRRSPLAFGPTFGQRALIDGEFFEACIQPLVRDATGAEAAIAHLDLHWTRVLPETHAQIEAPIHLFWGGADREFFPLELARQMRDEFRKRGELMVIPDAKLFVHEEAHEALSRFCLQVLAQTSTARRVEVVSG